MATMLDALSDRLATLITESDNPKEEMREIERRLMEADLLQYVPPGSVSPTEFANVVVRDNPQLMDLMPDHGVMVDDPQAIESPDELISLLLPASSA